MQKKIFDKIQYPFMLKFLETIGTQDTYLNIVNLINKNHTASITLNRGKPKAFPIKSGTGEGCPVT